MNDTKYFGHDSNARSDCKIIKIRKKHGLLGYGIYFCIVEMMACSKNYELETDYDDLAFELKEDVKIIEDIVKNYGLFVVNKSTFYSKSLKQRMSHLDKVREARARGGKKRWEKKKEEFFNI